MKAIFRSFIIVLILITPFTVLSQVSFTFSNIISGSGLPSKNSKVVEVFDYNNDGLEDLLCTVFICDDTDGPLSLFKNNGNGTFTDVSTQTNLNTYDHSSTYAADFNNDGFMDLVSVDVNTDSVYVSLFNGVSFVNTQYYLGDDVFQFFGLGDHDQDGLVDLYCSIRPTSSELRISVFRNTISNCQSAFDQRVDIVSSLPGTLRPTVAFADLDNDGDNDMVMVNVQGSHWNLFSTSVYRNDNKTYANVSTGSGLGLNPNRFIKFVDLDSDGDLDLIFATPDQTGTRPVLNRSYRNNGNLSFTDITSQVTITSGNHYYYPTICDFDNDGDFDIYHGLKTIYKGTAQLYRNYSNGTTWKSEAAAFNLNINAGGANCAVDPPILPSWIDFDNDGDMDVFVGRSRGLTPWLMENHLIDTNTGTSNRHFLKINLIGCTASWWPVGAHVKLFVGGSVYSSQSLLSRGNGMEYSKLLHFGLGNNTWVDSIQVTWPDGTYSSILDSIPADTLWNIYQDPNCSISHGVDSEISAIICDTFMSPLGNVYTSEGIYFDTLASSTGCDSIVKIELYGDSISPTVLTKDVVTYLDASGNAYITAKDVDSGSLDNCSIDSMALSKTNFNCSDEGSNTVTLLVWDKNGNVGKGTAIILVLDTITPVLLTSPTDTALGYCNSTFIYPLPTAEDNCSYSVTQIEGLPSGSNFPIGITRNTFEISDESGNMIQTSFIVDVRARYLPFELDDLSLCSNEGELNLTRGNDSIEFTGQGMKGNKTMFSPLEAEIGVFTITGYFTDSMGCITEEPFTIEVRQAPSIPIVYRVASDQLYVRAAYSGYQWYRNGFKISGEDERWIRVNELGVYSVVVANDNQCAESSESYTFGIQYENDQVVNKGKVKVHPNPTPGIIFIELIKGPDPCTITISDAVGVSVFERVISESVYTVDMSSYSAGTYYLRVQGSGINETVQINKQ